MICSAFITLILLKLIAAEDCPCGWKVEETDEVYTHRILEDFSTFPDAQNLLQEDASKASATILKDWMIYDF